MSIPREVEPKLEDAIAERGVKEAWPTTAEPTSPLWRYVFHIAAQERFGSSWKGAGFVSCTEGEHYNVISFFPGVVSRAAELHDRALRDPDIVANISDEPDGRLPYLQEPGRYSIPA